MNEFPWNTGPVKCYTTFFSPCTALLIILLAVFNCAKALCQSTPQNGISTCNFVYKTKKTCIHLRNCAINNKYDLPQSFSLQGLCFILVSLAHLHGICGYVILPSVHWLHVACPWKYFKVWHQAHDQHKYACKGVYNVFVLYRHDNSEQCTSISKMNWGSLTQWCISPFYPRITMTGASEQSNQSWWWLGLWRGKTLAKKRIKCWCELSETSISPRSLLMTCPCSWGSLEICSPLWMWPGREIWSLRSTWRSPL